jgi:hypothetical protein
MWVAAIETGDVGRPVLLSPHQVMLTCTRVLAIDSAEVRRFFHADGKPRGSFQHWVIGGGSLAVATGGVGARGHSQASQRTAVG